MEATPIQNSIIECEGNTVVMASPGSGKTFVISEKIKKILGDDATLDYQGVIAISYTRKASGNLKRRTLVDGVWSKNSFFGTIDSFCLTQIIIPFGDYVMGHSVCDIQPVAYCDLIEEQKENFRWITEGHPPYDDIKSPTWKLFYDLFVEGKVIIESLELLALHILKKCPACRKFIKARYKYVFIDEYQDADEYTNDVFLELISLGITGNVVGDTNQSIFGFAHKSSKYLMELEHHPEFTVFRLARNFRCSAPIVNYSNRLMDKNCTLIDTSEEGVKLITVDGSEERVAFYIDQFVTEDCEKNQVTDMSEVAILVKNKRTQEIIDEKLETPHRVIESTELDADLNPRSRLYGLLLQYYLDATMRFMTIIDEFLDYENLTISNRKRLDQIKEEIRSVQMTEIEEELPRLFKAVGDIILPKYEEGKATEHLEAVLADKRMLDTYRPITGDEVLIMTLHKAKGLEFDIVYHLNLNQWELPFKQVKNGDFNNPLYPNWEQDLDLHYVGVTRAKKACYLITNSQRHNANGQIKKSSPSEFLTLNSVDKLRQNYSY
ncbi:MAG: ATP-dependent helicase [Bacteroidales bacterium]|nr:ATP-dependent helicase [Bacteroidales bacterium]